MIADAKNQDYAGQVTMFDMGSQDDEMQKMKYNYTELPEYSEKEMLSMEKEMLGIYISGHPLEKYKSLIEKIANVNILQLKQANEMLGNGEAQGQELNSSQTDIVENMIASEQNEVDRQFAEKETNNSSQNKTISIKDGMRVRLVAIIDKVKKTVERCVLL